MTVSYYHPFKLSPTHGRSQRAHPSTNRTRVVLWAFSELLAYARNGFKKIEERFCSSEFHNRHPNLDAVLETFTPRQLSLKLKLFFGHLLYPPVKLNYHIFKARLEVWFFSDWNFILYHRFRILWTGGEGQRVFFFKSVELALD